MKFQDWLPSFLVALLDLPPVSKAMASSSIVRDAFHLYIRLGQELLQSIPDNPNENDLTLQKVEKKRSKMQQPITKKMNSSAKECSEELVVCYDEYDPYVIIVLNQL